MFGGRRGSFSSAIGAAALFGRARLIQGTPDAAGGQLAAEGEDLLAGHRDAHRLDLLLDERVEFLDT